MTYDLGAALLLRYGKPKSPGLAMDLNLIAAVLVVAGLVVCFSVLIDSYRATARIEGMEQAKIEILKGVRAHYQLEGLDVPHQVKQIVDQISSKSDEASANGVARYEYKFGFWALGRALGEGERD
jgi:hypothetical protein